MPGFRRLPLRCFVTVLVIVAWFDPVAGQTVPATGEANPKFENVEKVLEEMVRFNKASGLAVAAYVDGKLVYSRGLGWRDADKKKNVLPNDIFRLGGGGNAIASIAARKLIAEKKLDPDANVSEVLKAAFPKGAKLDIRRQIVTVKQVMDGKSGWDLTGKNDPFLYPNLVEEHLKLKRAAKPEEVVRYIYDQPLKYPPGSRTSSPSSHVNAYLLSRVVEKAGGKPFAAIVKELVLDPADLADIKPAKNNPKQRDPNEVAYPFAGDFKPEGTDAVCGLVGSAPSFAKLMEKYRTTGEERKSSVVTETLSFESVGGSQAFVIANRNIVMVVLVNGQIGFLRRGNVQLNPIGILFDELTVLAP